MFENKNFNAVYGDNCVSKVLYLGLIIPIPEFDMSKAYIATDSDGTVFIYADDVIVIEAIKGQPEWCLDGESSALKHLGHIDDAGVTRENIEQTKVLLRELEVVDD